MSMVQENGGGGSNGEGVDELLARRARLREWIERIDREAGDVPGHVTARVRADYERRLGEVIESLGAHRDAIATEVERLREELRLSSGESERTADELAEGRLRHRLGEWAADEWERRRVELERSAEECGAREAEAAAELARYEELLAQLDPAEVEEDLPTAAPPPDAWPELPGEGGALPPERPFAFDAPPAGDGGSDLAFLEGLDRALAEPEEEPDTRPPTGIKCPECGYTNDAAAWYCGVCGADLS